jgi:hypothetical protein
VRHKPRPPRARARRRPSRKAAASMPPRGAASAAARCRAKGAYWRPPVTASVAPLSAVSASSRSASTYASIVSAPRPNGAPFRTSTATWATVPRWNAHAVPCAGTASASSRMRARAAARPTAGRAAAARNPRPVATSIANASPRPARAMRPARRTAPSPATAAPENV